MKRIISRTLVMIGTLMLAVRLIDWIGLFALIGLVLLAIGIFLDPSVLVDEDPYDDVNINEIKFK